MLLFGSLGARRRFPNSSTGLAFHNGPIMFPRPLASRLEDKSNVYLEWQRHLIMPTDHACKRARNALWETWPRSRPE